LDTILKGIHPRTIPVRFGVIWLSDFREDLNVIFYQNMPNLRNRYKSAERKISPFQNCVRQSRLLFKMAVVTKNKNFFNLSIAALV
jgi:hypothetical protein